MSVESYEEWRSKIERKYALICKFCSRKVIDSCKNNPNQIFTENECFHCGLSKEIARKLKHANRA